MLAITLWGGVLWLGSRMFAMTPPSAGFDLELILGAGRRVAQGIGPYDPSMLAGHAPTAEDLFYSYPPPVAQAFSLVAGVPSGIALLGLAVVAVAGLALVTGTFARRLDPARSVSSAIVPVLAVAPVVFPFAIAILFGNLDLVFPLLYGAMALTVVLPVSRSRSPRVPRLAGFAGGASLAVAAIAKLHPVSLGAWFLVRGLHDRRVEQDAVPRTGDGPPRFPDAWRVLAAAIVVGVAIVGVSLLVGGVGPWQDYLVVVRAGSAADIVDRRNIGPAAQIAMLLGGSESVARILQVPVTLAAIAVTAWVAWTRRDAFESLAIAATASLVILPVTWFHYPVALLPFAVAAWLRARAARTTATVLRWLAVAGVIAALAIILPVALWLSVAAVLLAVHASGRDRVVAGTDPVVAGTDRVALARSTAG